MPNDGPCFKVDLRQVAKKKGDPEVAFFIVAKRLFFFLVEVVFLSFAAEVAELALQQVTKL